MKTHLIPLAASLSFFSMLQWSEAAPYASAVTVTGDNVTFVLNESADSVKVVFNEGASTLVIGASPEPAGTKTFSKAGFSSFRIEVEKNAGPGWKSGVLQQISQDTNDLMKFANGRGVAINRLPNTGPLFGRIYTAVATTGTAAPAGAGPARITNEGIYVLNADFSATTLGSGPLTGGLTFDSDGTSGAEGPGRLTVGQGGDLFIADWSPTNGSVFKTDGNVSGGKNVLGGPLGLNPPPSTVNFPLGPDKIHGSIAAVVTDGTEAAGNLKLWVIDEDLQTNRDTITQSMRNSIWQWDMAGDPLPMVNPPTLFTSTAPAAGPTDAGIGFATQTSDLCRSSDGTFYKLQRRSPPGNLANQGEPGIIAINASGVPLLSAAGVTNSGSRDAFRAHSGDNTVLDPFLESGACDISEDNWLAVLRRSDNAIHLVKVSMGIIDFSSHILLYTTPTTLAARDIAFDIAGNLYSLSSGQALLRVYAPGGHTKATTTSNGTFEILELSPTPPAPPLVLRPVITSLTRVGDDLEIAFSSRLGITGSLLLQRTTNLAAGPWENSTTAAFPAAQFTLTGSPPNFTFKAIGAYTANPPYFYRVDRN